MSVRAIGDAHDRRTLADRIYGTLEDDILTGRLEPGSRLRIVPLAARFGTSQAPVREAIQRLSEQGLAVTVPYLGAVLKEPTSDEILEIYELREELEALAVRRILARSRGGILVDQTIRRAFRELVDTVRVGAAMSVVDADANFHRAICAAADSPVLLELWSMITKRVRGVRLSHESRVPDELSTMLDTHRILLDALESGDPEVADQAIRQHLRGAVARLRMVRAATVPSSEPR